jgi:hypothetical protein
MLRHEPTSGFIPSAVRLRADRQPLSGSLQSEGQLVLDVTRLFTKANLPVPKVIDAKGTDGIILQEDRATAALRMARTARRRSTASHEMIEQAIQLIARIGSLGPGCLYALRCGKLALMPTSSAGS